MRNTNNILPGESNKYIFGKKPVSVNKTIKPVDQEDANVEAEKGEVLITNENFDGLPEHYVIAGHSHSEGGSPLNIPEDSFIFSKDKSLKLKDVEMQKSFGKSIKPSGYTMADIAKKYAINEYRKVLADTSSDRIQKETAEAMIANYSEKLGKLALIQESMKGFKDGIPAIAMPYIISTGFDPTTILDSTNPMEETTDGDVARYGGSKKRKVILMKAQQGVEIKPKLTPAYDAEEQAFLKALSPDIVLPEDLIPDPQSKKAKVYGDFQANQAAKNWEWYGQKIDWNMPAQVGDAQKAYNARVYNKMRAAGYSDKAANLAVNRIGFIPEQGEPNSLDQKAGKYFETRKDFNIDPIKKSTRQETADTTPAELDPLKINPTLLTQQKKKSPDFWTQDIINTTGAFRDLNSIKKYMPYIAPVSLVSPEANYFDPTRELAANAEQANIADLVSSMYAGPQRMAANAAAVQGKAGENAANILGKYNNMNVAEANKNAAVKADILNKNNMIGAERATELQMQTNAVNQQFDNSKRALRQNLRSALNTALTNRGQTQSLNFMHEQYQVDPKTGYTYFNEGRKGELPNTSASLTQKQIEEKVANLMRSIPGMTSEVAYKMATGITK